MGRWRGGRRLKFEIDLFGGFVWRVFEKMELWRRRAVSEGHRDQDTQQEDREAMTVELSRAWLLSKKNAIKGELAGDQP